MKSKSYGANTPFVRKASKVQFSARYKTPSKFARSRYEKKKESEFQLEFESEVCNKENVNISDLNLSAIEDVHYLKSKPQQTDSSAILHKKVDELSAYLKSLKLDQRIVTLYKKMDEKLTKFTNSIDAKPNNLKICEELKEFKRMQLSMGESFKQEAKSNEIMEAKSNRFAEMMMNEFILTLMSNLSTSSQQSFDQIFLIITKITETLHAVQWKADNDKKEKIESLLARYKAELNNVFLSVFQETIDNVMRGLITDKVIRIKLQSQIAKLTKLTSGSENKLSKKQKKTIQRQFERITTRSIYAPFVCAILMLLIGIFIGSYFGSTAPPMCSQKHPSNAFMQ